MSRKYLAFDIETAKIIQGQSFDLKRDRPLGISCIASRSVDDQESRLWMSRTSTGDPAPRMSRDDVAAFVQYLMRAATDGFTILTWNGLGFDFDIVAEESGLVDECRQLARDHVDMMFHVVCVQGYPIRLDKAAAGMGLQGKLTGVRGADAPELWSAGEYDLVCEYVSRDVELTLEVATATEAARQLKWITQRGTRSAMPLPTGWMPVAEAIGFPLPDTTWMDNPIGRESFAGWL